MYFSYPNLDSSYNIPAVESTEFEIDYIMVNGHPHRVAYAGDQGGVPVVLMAGIFEDDLSVFRWMINEMRKHPTGLKLRYIMLTIPFFEEYAIPTYASSPEFGLTYAKYDGYNPFTKEVVKLKGIVPVDPRYDHQNQAKTVYSILRGGLNIEKAHFIGHDRGAVILDYLLGEFPNLALSYSRGSQGWTQFDPSWKKLVEEGVFVGPPHNVFRTECAAALLRGMLNCSIPMWAPASPAWVKQAAIANPVTEIGQRWATYIGMQERPRDYFRRTREMFRQSDFAYEAARRADPENANSILKSKFPLQQFQSADELKDAADIPGAELVDAGTRTYKFADIPGNYGHVCNHVGDQPWFGKYNLFEGEVINLQPETRFQAPNDPIWQENFARYVTECREGQYMTLQTKPGARMNRFALIPNCGHWSQIENPSGCAAAIIDFIDAV